MFTHHRKLHAEIDRLKAQIALLKVQNEQERRNVEIVNERYKKVVRINSYLCRGVATVAPELGACVN